MKNSAPKSRLKNNQVVNLPMDKVTELVFEENERLKKQPPEIIKYFAAALCVIACAPEYMEKEKMQTKAKLTLEKYGYGWNTGLIITDEGE